MRPDVMCLRQLSLHNYRMFSDLSITFPDMSDDCADGDCEGAVEVEGDRGADGRGNWVTVIVGENSSGKTSILDAAIIALGTYLVKIPDIDKPTFNRTDARLARIEMHNTLTVDYQQQFPVSVSAHGDVMGNSSSWARSLKSANGPSGPRIPLLICTRRIAGHMTERFPLSRILGPTTWTGRLTPMWSTMSLGTPDLGIPARAGPPPTRCRQGAETERRAAAGKACRCAADAVRHA